MTVAVDEREGVGDPVAVADQQGGERQGVVLAGGRRVMPGKRASSCI
jgi:hypothetical protein